MTGPWHLRDVVPAAARSLGLPVNGVLPELGQARAAVVVLVDGLGWELLLQRRGHAPFLRSLLATGTEMRSEFPSTTATAMGSIGTGLASGEHGLVGYTVLDPDQDQVFNQLSWVNGPDPHSWQPDPTWFERMSDAGVTVTRVGEAKLDGSGLTNAALRGGRYVAATTLPERVAATVQAARGPGRSFVYLYWEHLDRAGHVYGVGSPEWGAELEAVDAGLAALVEQLPRDTSLTVTADHGMIDVPLDQRLDMAHEPDLAAGVRHTGGEMRSPQLYVHPGAAPDVVAAWRARLGERALVMPREQAVDEGWFGVVRDYVRPRIGDVVVAMLDDSAVIDSRVMPGRVQVLLGQHGSVTQVERAIPLLHQPAARG